MFRRCVGALVGLAMMGMAGSANAILIQANDPTLIGPTDDGFNLTQDTATGLEWLDLTLSINLSYNQVIGGAGGFLDAGFTIANQTQVGTLFRDAGAINLFGVAVLGQFGAAQTLIALLGCTDQCGSGNDIAQGFADFDPIDPEGIPNAFVQLGGAFGGIFDAFSKSPTVSRITPISTIGVFLVRPTVVSVPEPATIALFGIGLAGLGFMTRRRRNRRRQN